MAKNLFKADLPKLNEAIANNTIFRSHVTRLGFDENNKAQMYVQVAKDGLLAGTYIGTISIDEADDEMIRRSLMPLLNEDVMFVITGIDMENQQMICSRKRAQQVMKANMAQDFASGKTLRAKITKMMDFGAFVEVNGVSGVLRTVDFSSDHSEIPEYYNEGDFIEVVCKDISDTGRISFKALHTHSRKTPLRYDIQEGQVMVGKIRSIRTFESGSVAFVRIMTGLDTLCAMPTEFEVEKESQVAVRILRIQPSEDPMVPPQVRGKIVRVY